MKRWALSLLLGLAAALPVRGGDEDDPEEPPLVGRPENFSGAVGSYQISYRAAPTQVAVEEPVTLTVRITGSGPEKHRPERSKLRLFPEEVEKDFYIKGVPAQDRYLAKENTWEFVYRLKPKHVGIERIPPLEFVYYHPGLKRFQPTRTRETIALKVTPQTEAKLHVRALQAPERFYELASGPSVLRRGGQPGGLNLPLLALLLLGPPACCAAWYIAWRRLHPDAHSLTRRRRSRAATQALHALHALRGEDHGNRTGAIVAEYLHRRLDLSVHEPTPAEVGAYLERVGLPSAVAGRVAAFFRACDTARFAPGADDGAGLPAEAEKVVSALETELCTPRTC